MGESMGRTEVTTASVYGDKSMICVLCWSCLLRNGPAKIWWITTRACDHRESFGRATMASCISRCLALAVAVIPLSRQCWPCMLGLCSSFEGQLVPQHAGVSSTHDTEQINQVSVVILENNDQLTIELASAPHGPYAACLSRPEHNVRCLPAGPSKNEPTGCLANMTMT